MPLGHLPCPTPHFSGDTGGPRGQCLVSVHSDRCSPPISWFVAGNPEAEPSPEAAACRPSEQGGPAQPRLRQDPGAAGVGALPGPPQVGETQTPSSSSSPEPCGDAV